MATNSVCPRQGLLVFLAAILLFLSPAAPGRAEIGELSRAAVGAPPALAAVYRSLADPHDEVKRADGSTVRVPVSGDRQEDKGVLVTSYEELALRKVGELLADKGLQPPEQLKAAETILTAVLRFHAANRDRLAGTANPWQDLESRLEDKLLEVRRQQVQTLAGSAHQPEDWAGALARAGQLLELYPENKAVKADVTGVWASAAEERLKAGDFPAARAYVERIDREFVHHPRAQVLAKALHDKAKALAEEARSLQDNAAAAATLEQALQVWPRLPGLRDDFLKRRQTWTVLNVGVRRLPEHLSPATAWTDAEKQAVELLFERLVQEDYEQSHGERYRPGLAAVRPEVVPGGRRCLLDPDAAWSDGRRVTSADVRHTALLLANPELPGRTPEWLDLIEPPSVQGDPFRLDFHYRHLGLDPLAPLAFHVLPQTFHGQALVRADALDFSKSPVGSGPYRYVSQKRADGRTYLVFGANPVYQRAGRPGQPHLREIRFFVSTDPAADFRHPTAPLHLLLDLPTEGIGRLRRQGVRDIRTLENRRVYFLAVNHRVPVLGQRSLRLALAYGIDREKILTTWFRGGHPAYRLLGALGAAAAVVASPGDNQPQPHRRLNGPYPPGSWACAPAARVPTELHDEERARSQLRSLKGKEQVAQVELTLKYPDDDPRVEGACREIVRQLAAVGDGAGCPVRIKLVGLSPQAFRQALEQRDYELAYHHLDYDNEAYWLWPLFDSRPGALQPGGANFLGYQNDSALESLFRSAMSHRDFAQVKEIAYNIHAHLHDRMPLIPLWQLDTHLAVHPALHTVGLDPLRIFTHAAEWELQPQQ